MTRRIGASQLGLWALVAAMAGCTGVVDANGMDPNAGPGGGGSAPGTTGSPGPTVAGVTDECPAPVPRRLVQLSDLQFANSLRALFGESAVAAENAPKAET